MLASVKLLMVGFIALGSHLVQMKEQDEGRKTIEVERTTESDSSEKIRRIRVRKLFSELRNMPKLT